MNLRTNPDMQIRRHNMAKQNRSVSRSAAAGRKPVLPTPTGYSLCPVPPRATATAASAAAAARIACILLDDDDRDAYFARSVTAFAAVGFTGLEPVFVSPARPLRESDVTGADGIFVGGGLTPDYYDAIVPSAAVWLPAMIERGIPYAGFSAGAMIAPTHGIIGGWKLRRDDSHDLAICSEDVSEDLEDPARSAPVSVLSPSPSTSTPPNTAPRPASSTPSTPIRSRKAGPSTRTPRWK